MKNPFKVITLVFFLLSSSAANSQVIISLLFGEKLNSPKVEFGLIGGWNRSNFLDYEGSQGMFNFNLGFYFHFLIKNNSYISTGVLVKDAVGATGLPTYPIGNAEFDGIYEDGVLTKKIHYFYVPIMYHYRLNNRWYFQAGIQTGLRNRATDTFSIEVFDGENNWVTDTRKEYKPFDFGLVGGAGYKFKKQIKSIAIGVNYYYGIMNVSKLDDTDIRNSALYMYLKIPIGAKAPKEKKDKG